MRPPASAYDQRLLDLYDDLAHSRIDRRTFTRRAAAFVAAGVGTEALLNALAPNYALAQQVKPDDPRIQTEYVTYKSPKGGGEIRGLLAMPAGEAEAKFPAVLVIHENRGLNPYIEDVARRLAVAGCVALAPDALTPLGGYPGNDDEGRTMQQKRDGEEMTEDFIAGAQWLDSHARSTGKVGVVGFCFGGGMANTLAVRIPKVIDAAVPYYGRQPDAADVSKIDAAIQIHNAALDERILAGAPAYEAALKKAGVPFETYVYEGANHGFHNDTTPRYDAEDAKLAWERTIAFFNKHLKAG
ncbi:dienelactone hydrolase family protein [Alienimonas californiensis]|uniref:dienelactone hydrolase family protein n=1 Tax=Alienimonas californiensis TaxID=2527989 RepID=UPI0011A70249